MTKQTSVITGIKLDTATFKGTEEIIHPNYINFFFGKNGSGKTSIGRQIRDNILLTYDTTVSPEDYDVHVYNQDFIDEEFKTLDEVKGIFTFSKKSIEAEKSKAEKEAELKDVEAALKSFQERDTKRTENEKAIENLFKDSCAKNVAALRERFKDALKGNYIPQKFFEKVKNFPPKDDNEEDIAKVYNICYSGNAREYPFFATFEDGALDIGVLPSCSLLEKSIVGTNDSILSELITKLGSSDWVKKGHESYHDTPDNKCPYCQQKLPTNFEEEFKKCFDEAYEESIKTITEFRSEYRDYMNNLWRTFDSNTKIDIVDILPTWIDKLKNYKANLSLFTEKVRSNIALIDGKLKSPSSKVELEDITPICLDLAYFITEYNKAVDDNNKTYRKREALKGELKDRIWGLIAYRLRGELESYKLRSDDNNKDKDEISKGIEDNTAKLTRLKSEIKKLAASSKSIQPVVDAINKHLTDSGFEGFFIRSSKRSKNAYEVVRNESDKEPAKHLSEGERNFIAFLYFYHLVKGTLDASSESRKPKIVVVDDPVSSMDSGAMFIVSALVREMVEVCYNNADYRGQREIGNYIQQIFVLTHNAYFHKVITGNQVGRFESVNFYLVNKIDNRSSIKLCTTDSDTEAGEKVNYNPVKNYYAALWSELIEVKSDVPMTNVMQRILEYYFIDMCGYDGLDLRDIILVQNKHKITDNIGNEDREKWQMISALLYYMAAGVSDDLHLVGDGLSPKKRMDAFEAIFSIMKQHQHYEIMMERARLEQV